MTEPRRVEFQLLGQTLTVRTAESPDYIRTLAKYIDERVSALKRSGAKDPMTALQLAALDITDELFKARDDSARDQGDVSKRLGALVAILEKATPKEPA
ncbi:MAG: cell division protein ZapA [candidate division NC10 bacterium]|jgi:cell division protein ZapA (FtsZ GTPase activity inhibitor)